MAVVPAPGRDDRCLSGVRPGHLDGQVHGLTAGDPENGVVELPGHPFRDPGRPAPALAQLIMWPFPMSASPRASCSTRMISGWRCPRLYTPPLVCRLNSFLFPSMSHIQHPSRRPMTKSMLNICQKATFPDDTWSRKSSMVLCLFRMGVMASPSGMKIGFFLGTYSRYEYPPLYLDGRSQ